MKTSAQSSISNNISTVDALWAIISSQPQPVQKKLFERLSDAFSNDTKMTEEKFYEKIDNSLKSGISDVVMEPDENGTDFLNRILK